MTDTIPPDVLRKIRKLASLPEEARQSRFAVSVTRLTVLKSLCEQPEVANRFVTYLARKVMERVEQGKGRTSRPKGEGRPGAPGDDVGGPGRFGGVAAGTDQ